MSTDVEKFVIVGAGAAGREIAFLLRAYSLERQAIGLSPCECIGFLDDNPHAMDKFSMFPPVIGSMSEEAVPPNVSLVLGIGHPEKRYAIIQRFANMIERFPTVDLGIVRRQSVCTLEERGVSFGFGNVISSINACSFTTNIKIGNFNFFNGGIEVGHDSIIGNNCEIGTKTVLCGGTCLEDGVYISPGCVVTLGVKIGAWSKISAGTAVMKKVPPCSFVVGVPGKITKDFFVSPVE